ncbi:MAG: acetyl ornithine aminotransferase family protein [Candidatus Bathyarchaeota archaeon]|nr:acetyl ornithine aminotransferase family protein [Candidatus Bathyarchaeota archaeon]MDH5494527.1 acetyl ornithine aminotransferase family protein [Candidatus Bathyarchaeota archaeon]
MSDYPKIVVTPPGPKARELAKRDERVISQSFVRWYPLAIQSGKGCIIRDVDGNEYIDFNSGLVCLNVGHSHPRVVEAIKSQLDRFLHYSVTDFLYRQVVDAAEKLVKITPGAWEKKVFFGNSGAEAVEAGAKLARWHTRKQLYIAFTSAFHGRTFGGMSFTASKPVQRRHFFPLVPGVTHVPYGYCYRCPFKLTYPDCRYWCVDFIDEQVLQKYIPPEEVAAFVFEPIQGEGGYVVPPPEYFQRLKKLADKYGILMMDDEVQAGMGRTGKWFAIEHWGVEPDIICIAKSIAAGMPLGAMVAKASIMDWEGGSHASTFGGNPVSCAAASAVIDVIQDEGLRENAAKQGVYIMKRLLELKEESEIVGDVRGKGLMIGVELVEDKASKKPAPKKAEEVMTRSWKRGVAVITCGKSTVRIVPPLIITRELVDAGLDIVEDAIKQVEKQG